MSVTAETDRGGRLSVTMVGAQGAVGDTLWMASRQFSVLDRLWRLCDLADQFHSDRPKSLHFKSAVERLTSPGYPAEHSPPVATIQKNSPTVVEIVVTAGTTGVAGLMTYFIKNPAALGAWYWEVRLSSEAARARYLSAKKVRLDEEREADEGRNQLRRFVDQVADDLASVGPIELTSKGYSAEEKVNEMIEGQRADLPPALDL